MARGRQQKWICRDCKQEFFVQGAAPKLCCSCGSTNIGRAPSYELTINFEEKRVRIREICDELNPSYEHTARLKKEYAEILAYWKQQKARGYITKDEYEEFVRMFDGNNEKCP